MFTAQCGVIVKHYHADKGIFMGLPKLRQVTQNMLFRRSSTRHEESNVTFCDSIGVVHSQSGQLTCLMELFQVFLERIACKRRTFITDVSLRDSTPYEEQVCSKLSTIPDSKYLDYPATKEYGQTPPKRIFRMLCLQTSKNEANRELESKLVPCYTTIASRRRSKIHSLLRVTSK